MLIEHPLQANLVGTHQFRIIPSVYPPINFFEDLVNPDEMETLWEIESMTNERLRQETGDIFLVPAEDRVSGQGSSVVMAAFTHIGKPSRFTDGSFGIYYASLSLKTAIKETAFHRQVFLSATQEDPCELSMRVYEGKVEKALHDIRGVAYQRYHHQELYHESQEFGKALRADHSWGIIYNSVRDQGGSNIAALRPPAISRPRLGAHLRYIWDGKHITDVIRAQPMASILINPLL